jgi:amidase
MSEFTRREVLGAGAAVVVVSAVPRAAAGAFLESSAGTPAQGWQYASASEVAAAIRAGKVSSLELTKLALDRIERLNPKLNAVVTVTAEEALRRAKEADAALAKGEVWGPLHGVPGTVKDTFETAGVRTTAGATFLKDYVPKQDAVAVARLRAAGMVLLGKTNVPLMAGDWQSYNEIFGTTNNPWDLTRTPGGSTGGGAAALAAGLGYLTIGSDIGGSIRVPAHFCGVFGHKPTLNVVPLRGHIPPMPGTGDAALLLPVNGPLTRSTADLLLALRVLGGPLPEDAIAYGWKLPPARKKAIREYRIGYVLDHPLCPVTQDVKGRLQAAVESLRKAGARMEEGFPDGVNVLEQYRTYLQLLWGVDLAPSSKEEADRIRAASPPSDDIVGLSMKQAADTSAGEATAAANRRVAMRLTWQHFFGDHDAFLMPTDFVPAFPHDHSEPSSARVLSTPAGPRRYMDQLFWASFATMTGLPATVAPVGVTTAGLPVGIQILGPWLEDATPIFVAQALERDFGFRVRRGFE